MNARTVEEIQSFRFTLLSTSIVCRKLKTGTEIHALFLYVLLDKSRTEHHVSFSSFLSSFGISSSFTVNRI